jgi:Calcineurin-like phosphoesterase
MGTRHRLVWFPAIPVLLPALASAQLPFVNGFESGDTSAWSQGEHGPATVTLLVIGQTGEGNAAQSCVAQGMSSRCLAAPGGTCTAVLMGGDNFFDEGVSSVDDPQWTEKFEVPYDRPGLEGVPFYAVLGNADYDPFNVSHDGNKQAQIDYTFLPVGAGAGHRASDKWHMPAAWYDVVLGGGLVHLFALDTWDTQGAPPAGQAGDMQARVAASSAPWKLVLGHFARFTSGSHQTDLPLLNLQLSNARPPGLFALQRAVYCEEEAHGGVVVVLGLGYQRVVRVHDLRRMLEITGAGMRVESWSNNAGNCTAPVLAYQTVIPN